jgi:serine phosphatase RsbU (regulator of sigma subunit)
MERLQQSVDKLAFKSANELCSAVLTAVQEFTKNTPGQNDITAVGLMRAAVAAETELTSAATVR